MFLIAEFICSYERRLLPRNFHSCAVHNYLLHSHQVHTDSLGHRIIFVVNMPGANTRYFNTKCIGPTIWNAVPDDVYQL